MNRDGARVALVDRSGRRKNPQGPKFSQERTMEDHIGDWLMTDPDIAQALGVKLETWLNRVYEGTHPPCIRIRGLSRRYWHSDFVRWLDRHKKESMPAEAGKESQDD